MSWISDLAGKAEDILNKIDQNAANVLQQPIRADGEYVANGTSEVKVNESIIRGLKKNLSSSSLSLTKSLTPKKFFTNNSSSSQLEDKVNGSNLSSRRSSTSSLIMDQNATETPKNQKLSNVEKNSDYLSSDKEPIILRNALAKVSIERDELKEEVSCQQNLVAQTKKEVKELEVLVNKLAAERDEANLELTKLKENCNGYLKTIGETDANIAQFRQSIVELTEKLNWQMKETEQVKIELEEYRQKAKSTLQMKDKVIKELKSRDGLPADLSEKKSETVFALEMEGLRQENASLNNELNSMRQQLEDSKMLIQKLDERLRESQANASQMRESLDKFRSLEVQHSSQLETDVKFLNQEISALREEINRERESFSKQLCDKERELTKLRKRADLSKFPGPSSMENRVESLTQALVEKQSVIETLTADKNALKLQMEKIEEQLHHLMIQNRQHHNQIIYVNDTDDAKAQLPSLLRENPFDTNMARQVKRAYSSLDSAGIRIGVFLRRYPLVRIMVFIYVALLHLWVMFVLLSSTPT